MLAGQVGEVALAGEARELAIAAAVDRRADALHGVERHQICVPRVNRLELELLLQAREVEVVLLQLLRDEAVRLETVRVQLVRAGRGALHGP